MIILSFCVSGTYLSSFSCAYACNQLFRLMHRLHYHIATSCIIKRENARGETHDLYHVILYGRETYAKKLAAY